MSAKSASWIGQTLSGGRYHVTAKLGEGGMGFVYRARDNQQRIEVVIKVPRPEMLEELEFVARFMREIHSLQVLAHPHVARIRDIGKHQDIPFFVLQFLPGGSLRDRQHKGKDGRYLPGNPPDLHHWLRTIAATLDFIHGQHYLHRDIKPENILFDEKGEAHLSDFGIAKVLDDERPRDQRTVLTQIGAVLGTPRYMAPELVLGDVCDGRIDQYALAVTVYHLLSGRYPFEEANPQALFVQQVTQPAALLSTLVPSLATAVVQAVDRALAKDPKQRYPSCTAFAEALLRAVPNTAVKAAEPAAAPKPAATAAPPEASFAMACPTCRQNFALPSKFLGKRVKCPACAAIIQIPPVAPRATVEPPANIPVARLAAAANGAASEQVPAPPLERTVLAPIRKRLPGRWALAGVFLLLLILVSGLGVMLFKATTSSTTPPKENLAATNIAASGKTRVLLATGPDGGHTWQYTMRDPGPGWEKPGFDAADWKIGKSPFGAGHPRLNPRTNWESPRIWLRTIVNLPDLRAFTVIARFFHDDDITVYLNGKLLLEQRESRDYQQRVWLPGEWTFPPGPSTIAICVVDTGGARGVDFGLEWMEETPPPGQVLQIPGRATLHEMSVTNQKHLDATWMPPQWRQDGVFARLKGPGEIRLPALPCCWYVCDFELELENTTGRVLFRFGDPPPQHAFELNLGHLWNHDTGAEKLRTRLFAVSAAGSGWNGEYEFPVKQRLPLTIVTGEGRQALLYQGKRVLELDRWAMDLALRVWIPEDRPTTSGTLHRISFHELKAEDVRNLDWRLPRTKLNLETKESDQRLYQIRQSGLRKDPKTGEAFLVGTTATPMVWAPPGDADMGRRDPKNPPDDYVKIRLTKGFWIGQFELTQGEWEKLMGDNPSRIKGSPYLPVHWVSWVDAMRFCQTLTEREQKAGRVPTGYEYRLPTEAEWEYACRAGSAEETSLPYKQIWSQDTSFGRPHEVGEQPPNAWGLYDMHGNVLEWSLDRDRNIRNLPPQVDPCCIGDPAHDLYIVRGGAWYSHPHACRSFHRDHAHGQSPSGHRGFRIVLGPTIDRSKRSP